MKNWIPIFKTGTHTDSAGNTKKWTEQDLDNIVAKYNPDEHEAPIVIGHPNDNAPAYGWVEGMKRVGQLLYYKPKQVIDEFKEMVKKGLFKKRSLALYPDGTLRHIGYLGATPPAIKGLPDHTFSEGEGITIEFEEEYRVPMIGRMFQRLRDFIIDKYDTETADKVVSDFDIDELRRNISAENEKPLNTFSGKEEKNMNMWDEFKAFLKGKGIDADGAPPASSFSEADIQKRIDADVKAKSDELTKEFSEKEDALKKKEDALNTQASEAQNNTILVFCEGLKTKGVLTPAMEKHGMGLQTFMEQIATIETPVEFSEGDEKKKQTPLEFMQSFMQGLPKAIEFGEIAGKDKDTNPRGGDAGGKLESLTQQRLKDNKDFSYTQAFSEVQKEHPELATEYAEELKGGN